MAREPIDDVLSVADGVRLDMLHPLDHGGVVKPLAKQVHRGDVAVRFPRPPGSQRTKLDLRVQDRLQLGEVAARKGVCKRRAGKLPSRRVAGSIVVSLVMPSSRVGVSCGEHTGRRLGPT